MARRRRDDGDEAEQRKGRVPKGDPYAKHVKRFDALMDLETPAKGWEPGTAPPTFGNVLTDELAAALREEVAKHQTDGVPDQEYFTHFWGGYSRFSDIAVAVTNLPRTMTDLSSRMSEVSVMPPAEALLPAQFLQFNTQLAVLPQVAAHYRLKASECSATMGEVSAHRDDPDTVLNQMNQGLRSLMRALGMDKILDVETTLVSLEQERRLYEGRAKVVDKLHSLVERAGRDAEDLVYQRLGGRGGSEGRTGGAGS